MIRTEYSRAKLKEKLSSFSSTRLRRLGIAIYSYWRYLKKYPVMNYQPHEKQILFHESNKPIVMFLGGNRSGKTFALRQEVVWYVTEDPCRPGYAIHPYREIKLPVKVWCVSPDFVQSKGVMQEMVKAALNPSHFKEKVADRIFEVFSSVGTSKIVFKSCDSQTDRFSGDKVDLIAFDEEPKHSVYKECFLRTVGGGRIMFAMTPVESIERGITWTYTEFYQVAMNKDNPDIDIIMAGIYDNPAISRSEIARIERGLKTEEERAVRLRGEYRTLVGTCPFPAEQLNEMDEEAKASKPKFVGDLFLEGVEPVLYENPMGNLVIHTVPASDEQYYIGGDVAEGIQGGDYSCLQVISKKTMDQAAVWHGHIDPDLFGDVAVALALLYNRALLAIEKNNQGLAVLLAIKKKYGHIYYRRVEDKKTVQMTDRIGWLTDPKTKPRMISFGRMVVRDRLGKILDTKTIAEMRTFAQMKNQKYEAIHGCFDDRVIALMIAYQMYRMMPYNDELKSRSFYDNKGQLGSMGHGLWRQPR